MNRGHLTSRVVQLAAVLLLVGCSSSVGGDATGAPIGSAGPILSGPSPATSPVSTAPLSVSTGESAPSSSTGVVTITRTDTAPQTSTPPSATRPTATSVSLGSSPAAVPQINPAPACWSASTCPAVGQVSLGGGWRLVAVDPDSTSTVVILLNGSRPFDQSRLRSLGERVTISCRSLTTGPTCLVDGVPGAHTAFGTVYRIAAGRLRRLATDLAAEGGFADPRTTADSMFIAGPVSSFSYGLSYAAAPQAWRTYVVRGDGFTATGCSAPSFDLSGAPTAPQTGPCTGTPMISGFGPESAAKLADLTAGVVSASGNIWCTVQPYGRGELDCTIGKTDFTVPKNCIGEPGTIVRWPVGGKSSLSGCAGDTMVQAGRNVIPYGTLAVGGGFGCLIKATGGVRCQDGTGHGFVLARAGYSTF